MKTLFIQTHELAHQFTPHHYMCSQLAEILSKSTGGSCCLDGNQGFDIFDSATLVILALVREQKEDFVDTVFEHEYSSPYYYRDGLIKVNGFYLETLVEFSTETEIRQRLINSLLTRPDRTICVLIPE